jgi:TorA maturation chaperone TorD
MRQGSDPENHLIGANQLLLEARIFSYDLLRQTFIKEPESDYIATLKNDAIMSGFPFADEHNLIHEGVNMISRYLETPSLSLDEIQNALRWDYTRLFIGPDKLPAPPWESVYLSPDRLLFQKQTMQVRRIYRKFGYIPRNHPHEADDHLGLELDFMFKLASRTKEDIDQKRFESALDLLQDQSSFLDEHLLKWVPLLVDDVLGFAETPFFQGMAKVLRGYLEKDRDVIDEITEAIHKVSVVG